MTTKILTVRIPAPMYSALCAEAAAVGVPIATHVRRLVETEHQANQIELLRFEMRKNFEDLATNAAPGSLPPPALFQELLLLTRAIAAHCNPQLVSQVRAKISNNQQAGV